MALKDRLKSEGDTKSAPKINATDHGMHRTAAPIEAEGVVLGNEYTDIITGIKGMVDAVYTFLTGCDQVALQYLKDGEPLHLVVDASRLKELKEERAAPVARPGGPARAFGLHLRHTHGAGAPAAPGSRAVK